MLGLPKNPIDLLHPLIYSEDNLAYANQAYNDLKFALRPQAVMPQLDKEVLEQMTEHKWLKQTETILYHTESLENLLELLRNEAKPAPDYINKNQRPIIALDLETTGLNKGIKLIQGEIRAFNDIVGVCIACDKNKGFYIPVNHTEIDKIPNYKLNEVIEFLQSLVNEFHIVYHNAVFDQEVMALQGVKFKYSSHSDTLILGFLMGYKDEYKQLGLKFLSKTLLERQMVEIGQVTGSKEVVRMQTTPAKNAYVYGCSDAMNTLALFEYITKDKGNPYKTQKLLVKLLNASVASTRSMFRVGLPVGYDIATKTTKTLIRRMIMLENIFYAKISDSSVSITSAEQLGIYLYKTLKKGYEAKFNGGNIITKENKAFNEFVKRVKADFDMDVKITTLKNGTEKISANSKDEVLQALYNKLESWDFISTETRNEIYIICEVMSEYRTLFNKLKIYIGLVRNCYNDDLNMCRVPISLKLLGTTTGRFSNDGSKNGAWDRITLNELKKETKPVFVEGQGRCEFNAQGLSHESGHWQKLKKVKNFKDLNPKFKEVSCMLDKMVNARLYDYIAKGDINRETL